MTSYSNTPRNGNGGDNGGNGAINGRGIKHRDLSHNELVELAADAVSGMSPVVPSLGQVPKIFEGVTPGEVSSELKRREAVRKETEAEGALFEFATVWEEQSLSWRAEALKWFATESNLSDIWNAYVRARIK
jgi:hypothetical protein